MSTVVECPAVFRVTVLWQCECCATLVDVRNRDGYAYCPKHRP